ncbi:MAG: alpha/beta fold hydrolase [Caryophanon sp.]|nr:alpha/beta fold hydrolase [Caryophanon sp.]
MKKQWLISSVIGGVTTIAISALGMKLSNRLMYIQKKEDDFILQREITALRYNEQWFNDCPKQSLTIDSPNGYTLKGYFLKPLQTTNTVIICHGVTENKVNSARYARMFESLGYNTVIYDHRRHGESGGKTTSYGHYEKFDLQAVVRAVRAQIGNAATLGIHGESMGAATTLLYAGTVSDDANFYISDCAFSSFRALLTTIIKNEMKIQTVPFHIANFFVRVRDGYSVTSIMPIEAVKRIEKPVLFLHSLPDAYIPANMSVDLYNAKQGDKALHLFEHGAHAQSFNENSQQYEEVVRQFLARYVHT